MDNSRITFLSALDASMLARIAGNPDLARDKKKSLLKKLSPKAQQVAHALLDDTGAHPVPREAKRAARVVRNWTRRQPKNG